LGAFLPLFWEPPSGVIITFPGYLEAFRGFEFLPVRALIFGGGALGPHSGFFLRSYSLGPFPPHLCFSDILGVSRKNSFHGGLNLFGVVPLQITLLGFNTPGAKGCTTWEPKNFRVLPLGSYWFQGLGIFPGFSRNCGLWLFNAFMVSALLRKLRLWVTHEEAPHAWGPGEFPGGVVLLQPTAESTGLL